MWLLVCVGTKLNIVGFVEQLGVVILSGVCSPCQPFQAIQICLPSSHKVTLVLPRQKGAKRAGKGMRPAAVCHNEVG